MGIKNMTAKTGNQTRFSTFIEKKLMESTKTQKEIAQAVGYKNQNMITMLKLGDVKLALDRVPAMAKALDMDPLDLFKIALTQFYDNESVSLLVGIIERGISPAERKILETVREASGSDTPELTPERAKKLAKVFAPEKVKEPG
jgi:transcriptional regulator with XRE-family HTH domain